MTIRCRLGSGLIGFVLVALGWVVNPATTGQQVRTHASGASCGLEISGPGPHLVFARAESDGTVTADLCGGTRTGPVPASLGPGQAPAPEPPGAASSAPGPVPVGLGVVLLGLGAALVIRRSRSARSKS